MAQTEKTVDVMVSGNQTRKHQGDDLRVDNLGNLLVQLGNDTVCIYPPGQWLRAWLAGNLQDK